MDACVCGSLREFADEEGSPIRYDTKRGRYRIEISDNIVVDDAKCPLCGGQGVAVPDPRMCDCGSVESWNNAEGTTVHMPEHSGLYMLRGRQRSDGTTIDYAIWYCPVCGGRVNDGVAPGHEV